MQIKTQFFAKIFGHIKKKQYFCSRKRQTIMDDYHAENATSTCQEVSGAALFDGPHGRPKNS